jgi:hypothetical protein
VVTGVVTGVDVVGFVDVVVVVVVVVVVDVWELDVVVVDAVPQEAKIIDKASVPHKIKSAIFPFILSPFIFVIVIPM